MAPSTVFFEPEIVDVIDEVGVIGVVINVLGILSVSTAVDVSVIVPGMTLVQNEMRVPNRYKWRTPLVKTQMKYQIECLSR